MNDKTEKRIDADCRGNFPVELIEFSVSCKELKIIKKDNVSQKLP